MEVTTHRRVDEGFVLQVSAAATSEDEVKALAALGDSTAGDPTEFADDGGIVTVLYPPLPSDPETGKPLMTEKEYAEMQVREAGLLIQSALDSASQGKGKKLASEGTTIEV